MALDKLVDSTQLDSDLTSVANAIRAKSGGSGQLAFPAGFVSEIGNIPTGGGGGTSQETAILDGSISGDYTNNDVTGLRAQALSGCNSLTSVSMPNVTAVGANAFYNCTNIEALNLPKLQLATANYCFANIKKLTTIAFPDFRGGLGGFSFSGDTLLTTVDIGPNHSSFNGQCFASTALNTLILRRTSVVSLNNINNFNNTPFASGGTGGTIYIPKSLYDHLGDNSSSDYKAATNWSTVNGYGTITWAKIEGSYFEAHYADGTAIT